VEQVEGRGGGGGGGHCWAGRWPRCAAVCGQGLWCSYPAGMRGRSVSGGDGLTVLIDPRGQHNILSIFFFVFWAQTISVPTLLFKVHLKTKLNINIHLLYMYPVVRHGLLSF
jgi:hypothetical protein